MLNGNILNDLKQTQKKLDTLIFHTHDLSYEQTFQKRKIAFLIEIAEFMNATRAFKFWSYKKSHTKEILLEEYVDGLHFLLSIATDLQADFTHFAYYNLKFDNLEQWYLELNEQFILFHNVNTFENYFKAVNIFLNLPEICHFLDAEVIRSYYLKLHTNYERQKTAY